jgi:hypothetical protein
MYDDAHKTTALVRVSRVLRVEIAGIREPGWIRRIIRLCNVDNPLSLPEILDAAFYQTGWIDCVDRITPHIRIQIPIPAGEADGIRGGPPPSLRVIIPRP